MIEEYTIVTCEHCEENAVCTYLASNGKWELGCTTHYNIRKRDSSKRSVMIFQNFVLELKK